MKIIIRKPVKAKHIKEQSGLISLITVLVICLTSHLCHLQAQSETCVYLFRDLTNDCIDYLLTDPNLLQNKRKILFFFFLRRTVAFFWQKLCEIVEVQIYRLSFWPSSFSDIIYMVV